MIVTVGGTITWQAAAKDPGGSFQPFISLIGGRSGANFPKPDDGMFKGGISLESFRRNPDRLQRLLQRLGPGAQPDEICLLSNPNSQMAKTETAAWIGRTQDADVNRNNVANASAIYQNAFASISAMTGPVVRGVLVSADPYFKRTGAQLVAEANNWVASAGRFICYPLREYASHNPTGASTVLRGPRLLRAYRRLGAKAKRVLQNPTAPGTIDEEVDE